VSNSKSNRRTTIQSVDRAARILKLLANGSRGLGVSEIADRLGLARPTVHGLLQTLMAHGFVEQPRGSDKYRPSVALLQLGYSYLDVSELRARSLAHAERLAQEADAAVRVGIMHGRSVVVIHHVFRPDTTLQILEVGAHVPAHASALGKAMLAFFPPQELEEFLSEPLEKLTGRTPTAGRLRTELITVGEEGYARERDDAILGEASIAAPIFDHTTDVVGAIGIVGESSRFGDGHAARRVATTVMEAARNISRELGATRWPARA
jgi:DNA-binding IclR family transcriptional regulator